MTEEMRIAILAAIELKIGSVKRASKTANAKFAILYNEEITTLNEAANWIRAQKITAK